MMTQKAPRTYADAISWLSWLEHLHSQAMEGWIKAPPSTLAEEYQYQDMHHEFTLTTAPLRAKIGNMNRRKQAKKLLRVLKHRRWSYPQIGKAIGAAPKTVQQWTWRSAPPAEMLRKLGVLVREVT